MLEKRRGGREHRDQRSSEREQQLLRQLHGADLLFRLERRSHRLGGFVQLESPELLKWKNTSQALEATAGPAAFDVDLNGWTLRLGVQYSF
jgi:hypothetical protein